RRRSRCGWRRAGHNVYRAGGALDVSAVATACPRVGVLPGALRQEVSAAGRVVELECRNTEYRVRAEDRVNKAGGDIWGRALWTHCSWVRDWAGPLPAGERTSGGDTQVSGD